MHNSRYRGGNLSRSSQPPTTNQSGRPRAEHSRVCLYTGHNNLTSAQDLAWFSGV